MVKLRLLGSIAVALTAAAYSSAQRPPLPDHFGKWSAVSPSSSVKPENTQEELLETGFVNSLARTYSDGGRTLNAAVYQFRDPSSAYEIYTSELDPSMSPSTVGNNTAVGGSTLVALTGNLVVRIWPVQNPSTEELRELMKSLRARSEQTPLPPIRSYLPLGFTDGTQRYALGAAAFRNAFASLGRSEFVNLASEAGFGSGAEAMFAQYRAGKDEAVVLLIEYPTPQLAEQHLRHLEQALSPAAKQAGTTIERKASLLSLILKPSSAAYGDALRSAVNYETQVTWNEPTHMITDPPWATILGKIFIFTFLFMIVAVVLGVAFGGVRVITKMLFPGKVFDRPDRMDVLQLGLSGKRIDSRDFY